MAMLNNQMVLLTLCPKYEQIQQYLGHVIQIPRSKNRIHSRHQTGPLNTKTRIHVYIHIYIYTYTYSHVYMYVQYVIQYYTITYIYTHIYVYNIISLSVLPWENHGKSPHLIQDLFAPRFGWGALIGAHLFQGLHRPDAVATEQRGGSFQWITMENHGKSMENHGKSMENPWKTPDFTGKSMVYTLVN